jgi:GT2 family glycosyltransferase
MIIMLPKVSLILLNWNGWEDTIECLESLFQISYPNYDVIIVDNNSQDDSISKIRDYAAGKLKVRSKFFEYNNKNKPIKLFEFSHHDKTVTSSDFSDNIKNLIVIKNEKNYGFAEGNNIGIEFAINFLSPDFLFLLNNDTVVSKNFLSQIIKVVRDEMNVAIAGPKVYYYDYNGKTDVLASTGGYLNWLTYPGYHNITELSESLDEPIKVDWITGAALMIRADIPHKYLSNDFFFGAEDVDLCIRLKEENYEIYLVPTSRIWHKVSVSREKKYSSDLKSLLHGIKSNFFLVKRHKSFYFLFYILYIFPIAYAIIIIYFRKVRN